jgi:hypothetical protein
MSDLPQYDAGLGLRGSLRGQDNHGSGFESSPVVRIDYADRQCRGAAAGDVEWLYRIISGLKNLVTYGYRVGQSYFETVGGPQLLRFDAIGSRQYCECYGQSGGYYAFTFNRSHESSIGHWREGKPRSKL